MRAFVENARETVADETPRSLASSLELICFFSEFTTLDRGTHRDGFAIFGGRRFDGIPKAREAQSSLYGREILCTASTNREKTLQRIVQDFNLFTRCWNSGQRDLSPGPPSVNAHDRPRIKQGYV